MQIRLLLPTSLAMLAATAAPVLAGQCTEEINALSEELGALDPEPGADAAATAQRPSATGRASRQEERSTAGGDAGTALVSEAGIALNQARDFDLRGLEEECRSAVRKARELSGR